MSSSSTPHWLTIRSSCQRSGEVCDYSIRLNWDGRRTRKPALQTDSFVNFSIVGEPSTEASPAAEARPGSSRLSPSAQEMASTSIDSVVSPTAGVMSYFDGGLGTTTAAVTAPAAPPYGLMRSIELFTPGYGIPPVLAREAGDALVAPASPALQTESGQSTPLSPRPPKRARLSVDSAILEGARQTQESPQSSTAGSYSAATPHPSALSRGSFGSPVTPYQSPCSEDSPPPSRYSNKPQSTSDPRQMSATSPVSGALASADTPSSQLRDPSKVSRTDSSHPHNDSTYYGIDRGLKDLDLGMNAVPGASPLLSRERKHYFFEVSEGEPGIEFGFGNNLDFRSGGYYDQPVAIRIPRSLEPLPAKYVSPPWHTWHSSPGIRPADYRTD